MYEAIRKENCKKVYQDNEQLYLEGVKYPLDELYFEMFNYFNGVDRDLLSNRRRCISSAYNDARFCCGSPIKEYFYIRFKLNKMNKKNALGFFFDASLDGYKYGLNIYNSDASGMNQIRDYILDNKHFAKRVIEDFNDANLLEIQGEKYKKAYYPKEDIILQEWLPCVLKINCLQLTFLMHLIVTGLIKKIADFSVRINRYQKQKYSVFYIIFLSFHCNQKGQHRLPAFFCCPFQVFLAPFFSSD